MKNKKMLLAAACSFDEPDGVETVLLSHAVAGDVQIVRHNKTAAYLRAEHILCKFPCEL